MGFLDDLKNSISSDEAMISTSFPESGTLDGATEYADERISYIKNELKRLVDMRRFTKEGFRHCYTLSIKANVILGYRASVQSLDKWSVDGETRSYEYGSIYRSATTSDINDSRLASKKYGAIYGDFFPSWESIKIAFSKVEDFLNTEGIAHEYYHYTVPIGSSFAKMVKVSGYDKFMNILHDCLKRGWDYNLKKRNAGNDFGSSHAYQIDVKIYCDSKGNIK